MNLKKATIDNIKLMLGSKILPFFQQEKIDVDIEPNEKIQTSLEATGRVHLVELPRPSSFDYMCGYREEIKYFNSPELNINKELLMNKKWSKALKSAEYFINDVIELTVADLKYYVLHGYLKKGFIPLKRYRYLGIEQPIKISHNGENIPVASLNVRIAFPEDICEKLKSEYVGKYADNTKLRLTVKGLASLFGGHDVGAFKRFHVLNYYLAIYPESYELKVID